jgi:hypothetical protein
MQSEKTHSDKLSKQQISRFRDIVTSQKEVAEASNTDMHFMAINELIKNWICGLGIRELQPI